MLLVFWAGQTVIGCAGSRPTHRNQAGVCQDPKSAAIAQTRRSEGLSSVAVRGQRHVWRSQGPGRRQRTLKVLLSTGRVRLRSLPWGISSKCLTDHSRDVLRPSLFAVGSFVKLVTILEQIKLSEHNPDFGYHASPTPRAGQAAPAGPVRSLTASALHPFGHFQTRGKPPAHW